jgi:hypothetical protein
VLEGECLTAKMFPLSPMADYVLFSLQEDTRRNALVRLGVFGNRDHCRDLWLRRHRGRGYGNRQDPVCCFPGAVPNQPFGGPTKDYITERRRNAYST